MTRPEAREFATGEHARRLHDAAGWLTMRSGFYTAMVGTSHIPSVLSRLFPPHGTGYHLIVNQTMFGCPTPLPDMDPASCTGILLTQRNAATDRPVVARYNLYRTPTAQNPEEHHLARTLNWPKGLEPPDEAPSFAQQVYSPVSPRVEGLGTIVLAEEADAILELMLPRDLPYGQPAPQPDTALKPLDV
jgi:hypothetical protein